jgi:hypothetical protein
VSKELFAVSLVVGAALLALWADVRFPLRDLTLQRIVPHAVAALAILFFIPESVASQTVGVVVVFAFVLPALVYMFLTAAWFVRFLQSALGSSWS